MASESGVSRRWSTGRLSVRLRLTIGATLLATVTFAIFGLFMLSIYHNALLDEQHRRVRQVLAHVAAYSMDRDQPPEWRKPDQDFTESIQVLDANNRVIAGDSVFVNRPPMMTLLDGQTKRTATIRNPRFRPGDREIYVEAALINSAAGNRTVIVADTVDGVNGRTARAQMSALTVGIASILVVAYLSWAMLSRALRPVERLRGRVADITASGDLSHRVPQSPGGDEIGRLAHTLNEMLGALEAATKTQQRFVADAAHELRTPLAGITAFLEVAASHPETIDRAGLVTQLLVANKRMIHLASDLLTLAGLDAGAPIRYRPIDLAGVIQDCLFHLGPTQVRVENWIGASAVVLGNETHLTEVVTNLIANALRHARSTAWISLTTSEAGAVLTVIDDGPGIPLEHRDRIWDRFVRLDDDRGRASGGTGLGLALVKKIVTAHGGAVRVDDAHPGPGAAFTVTLPLVSAAQGGGTRSAPAAEKLRSRDGSPSKVVPRQLAPAIARGRTSTGHGRRRSRKS